MPAQPSFYNLPISSYCKTAGLLLAGCLIGGHLLQVVSAANPHSNQPGNIVTRTMVMGDAATPPKSNTATNTWHLHSHQTLYFSPDRMTVDAEPLPNDPYAHEQWNFMPPDQYAGAANLFNTPAHNGSQSQVVVAIVDSGMLLDHEDYTTLPGYDFVHDPLTANDGDGRDNDPTDPGDWVTNSDIAQNLVAGNCQVTSSKWHGTAIAGIIGALSQNQLGVAGGTDYASLLPVRVTGKCGGYVTDLIDGIRWAAGLPVSGVPNNPTPARIINLSVGFPGTCSSQLQSTIDAAVGVGAILVTAATNNPVSLDQQPHSPATCKNVLTIGAALRNGLLADYSAHGSSVFLLGPGGSVQDGIVSTDNAGLEHAQNQSDYGYHFGSSLAAAHVSAALATLISIDPALSNESLEQLLIRSAGAINDDSKCQRNNCGFGKLNTNRAVRLLLNNDVDFNAQKFNDVLNDDNTADNTPLVVTTQSAEQTGLGSSGLSVMLLLVLSLPRARSVRRVATSNKVN